MIPNVALRHVADTSLRAGRLIAVWIGASLLFSTVEALQLVLQGFRDEIPRSLEWRVLSMLPAWLIFVALLWGVRWLVRRYPVDVLRRARAIRIHALAAVSFPVVHMSALTVVKLLSDPGMRLRYGASLISYYYVRGVVLYIMAAAFFHAIEASRRASEREARAASLEASLARAQLATLRAQLSPHFLFNVLNSLGMLVRAGRDSEALDLLEQFAGLLRHFLRERSTELVPLDEELRFAEEYLKVQKMRFNERLRVSFEVSAGVGRVAVPTFVLYPLVENAVKHGMSDDVPLREITVRARGEGERVILEVEDDGPGLRSNQSQSISNGRGVGLDNLRARLRNLYSSGAALLLVPRQPHGLTARVELPRVLAAAETTT